MHKSAKTHFVLTVIPQEGSETFNFIIEVSVQLKWFPCLLSAIFSWLHWGAEPDCIIKITWYAKFQIWNQ